MRNYENEQYAFLAHYGVPGMKRPRGLRYKTKGHSGDVATDFIRRRKPSKFITDATSKLNKSVADDTTEFYKNKAKGESNNSLRLKRIAQVRATEAMAPVAAAQKKLFKKKKELPINQKAIKLLKVKNAINNNYKNKKNAFLNNTFVQPGLEAKKPENQAARIVKKATKKATENTTNPFVNGNMRKSMEKQIEKAKSKKVTAKAARSAHADLWTALYRSPGNPKRAANNALQPIKHAPDNQTAALLTNKVMTKEGKIAAKKKELESKYPDWYKKAKKKK